jgi:hypothetical protein
MLRGVTAESQAMTLTCLQLFRDNQKLGEKMIELLQQQLEPFLEGKVPTGFDVEGDVLPVCKWTNFFEGYLIGRGLVRI